MSTEQRQPEPPSRKRRWLQYSPRTLLIVVAICCVWMAIASKQARDQRLAVTAIEEAGGRVFYEHQILRPKTEPPGPDWLRQLIGDEYFFSVQGVSLDGAQVKDASLDAIEQAINQLIDVQELSLKRTKTSDGDLEHLKGLTNLQVLRLTDTQITDAGLIHLNDLTNLEVLSLYDTQIADKGLEHVKGLSTLQILVLGGTGVTDAGLVHLRGFTKLQDLELSRTKITDAGLVHLKGLTKLTSLGLIDTQVTEQGVSQLQQALPNCEIRHSLQ